MRAAALLGALASSLALATPALASPVWMVKGNQVVRQDDPALPAQAGELPLAPPTGCRSPATATSAAAAPQAGAAGGASVRAVLLRDLRKGALTQQLYEQYRDEYKNAKSAVNRLGGIRRANLEGVVRSLERISRSGLFTVSR